MFWLFAAMSMAVFAPCVLVPLWAEIQILREQEARLARAVGELEAVVARNDARIDALLSDPAVIQRVVRREFNYRMEGEEVVRWRRGDGLVLDDGIAPPPPPVELETTPPGVTAKWLSALTPWLPRWPWQELFNTSPNREILLIMSGGLLVAAFLLYGPSPRRGNLRNAR
jgi:hypothetical protein